MTKEKREAIIEAMRMNTVKLTQDTNEVIIPYLEKQDIGETEFTVSIDEYNSILMDYKYGKGSEY